MSENRYLINLEEEDCKAMNRAFAIEMGCDSSTEFWFNMWKHPVNPLWLLSVDPEHEFLLTEQQISELQSYAIIQSEGWIYPPPFTP